MPRTRILLSALVLALALPCVAHAKSGAASSAGSKGSFSGGSVAPAATSSGSAGRSGSSSMQNSSHYRNRPTAETSRRVSEQDCAKPIVADGGNLRCK